MKKCQALLSVELASHAQHNQKSEKQNTQTNANPTTNQSGGELAVLFREVHVAESFATNVATNNCGNRDGNHDSPATKRADDSNDSANQTRYGKTVRWTGDALGGHH